MKRIVFLHNFKCGGTTLRNAFHPSYVYDILPGQTEICLESLNKAKVLHVHQALGDRLHLIGLLEQQYGVDSLKHDTFFLITIRNPVALLESFFRWGLFKNHGRWFGIFPPFIRYIDAAKTDSFEKLSVFGSSCLSKNYAELFLNEESSDLFNLVIQKYIYYYSRLNMPENTLKSLNMGINKTLIMERHALQSPGYDSFDHFFVRRTHDLIEKGQQVQLEYSGQQCNRLVDTLGVTLTFLESNFTNVYFIDTELQDQMMAALFQKNSELNTFFKPEYIQSLVKKRSHHVANLNPVSNKIASLNMENIIDYSNQYPDDFLFWESCIRHAFDKLSTQ